MSLQYVIDGYNIIKHTSFTQHALKKKLFYSRYTKDIRKKFDGPLRDLKGELLEFIKINRLCGSPKNKITVVFDGYPDSQALGNDTEINVIFARKESADEKIKKIIEESANPKNIAVISDDKEIRLIAKSFGARVLGVQDFIGSREESQAKKEVSLKSELTYSQMQKINQELRKIWLK